MTCSHNAKQLAGQKFGQLTVLSLSHISTDRKRIWLCQCSCGNFSKISSSRLGKAVNSCGCLRKSIISEKKWQGHKEISKDYWSSIVRGAKTRDIFFDITIEYAWELYEQQKEVCSLSGLPIRLSRNIKKQKATASLDRIDSHAGYVVGNIQWVHKQINICKNVLSCSDFVELCKQVSKHNG